jgi:isopenicillin-N N-acyltransferase-like protein
MEMATVPLFEISGNPEEMGLAQGSQASDLIHSMLADYRSFIHAACGLRWEEAVARALDYLPAAQTAYPDLVQEVRGIAAGAGASFEDIWLLNCYEEVAEDQQLMACTTIAVNGEVTADGHVYLAHNEDWISVDRKHVYLVRAEPRDGPTFLGMSYGALLCNIGLNAAGIGVGINSVYPQDVRVGVPRIVVSRRILSARDLESAVAACVPEMRAGGYNHLLAEAGGAILSVESSATRHETLQAADGWLAHTNHYRAERMQALEQPGAYASSRARLQRVEELVRGRLDSMGRQDLQAILRDHSNRPLSICGHEQESDPPHERGCTVISLIMDLTDQVMWAALGPPCQGEFTAYEL